jgi:hypothetical protein
VTWHELALGPVVVRGEVPEVSRAWGAARHHLLSQHRITSKSGAGRYVVEHLDARWSPIAEEALRIRERPGTPSLYDDAK